MKFKRQSREIISVNLTPLIDIVFLLLIFFMVSTTFTKETQLRLQLPEAESAETSETQVDVIDIVVSANGDYVINGQSLISKQTNTLREALARIAGDRLDVPVVITGDANAAYQDVIRAMDAAGQIGLTQISLTTQNPVPEQ